MRLSIRFCFICVILVASGCATNRSITITARPTDALLQIDGIERGQGPLTENFSFSNDTEKHTIGAKRLGYKDFSYDITKDYTSEVFPIEMQHQSRKINLTVFPVPAYLFLDGAPISTEMTSAISPEVQFTVDARGDWQTHTITATRFGFADAKIPVSWTDGTRDYTINLEHLQKDLTITTNPPGADVYLDDQHIGKTQSGQVLKDPGVEFATDTDTNQWKPRKLTATKAGYEPAEKLISYPDKTGDYTLDLAAKSKSLRIVTDPPGAVVTLDGKELQRDATGVSFADRLEFPPDEKGVLKTFSGLAKKKTSDSEWEPLPFTIAFDNGKSDYALTLKEILIRPVPVLEAVWERGDEGWTLTPREHVTIGMKSTSETGGGRQPVLITHVNKGETIDTLDVSPDGTQLLFTILAGKERNAFHSRMTMVRTDGAGGVDSLSDGRSLDLTPSFSPDGTQIAFASDRFGRHLSICTMAANGAPGIRQLTAGDNNVLWPSLDSEPQPRLFYQAMVDTLQMPELWSTPIGTSIRSDLQVAGTQPRISPRDDQLVFVTVNEKTNKREIFRVSDKGGVPENLTNTPDDDEYDPAWSKDGGRIAFVAERGGESSGSADTGNADIWVLDLKGADKPMQITSNTSVDDHPVWDPSGNYIYFRSNRGGSWGIWKLAVR